eukprot:6191333-Karenia_brevis.AAC.1
MIDQFRHKDGLPALNMRHVIEAQYDVSDEEAFRIKNAKPTDLISCQWDSNPVTRRMVPLI